MVETSRLTPDEVASQEFSHGFRGYDVQEVRSHLRKAASEMARLTDEVVRLSAELVMARQQSAAPVSLTPQQATELLGADAARIIQTAENAGRDIQRRAEENVEKMLREARSEAAEIRSNAQQDVADVLETAERRAKDLEGDAKARHTAAVEGASKVRTDAYEYARNVVDEAKAARKEILQDLADRRQRARREITQLRAGIDQLRETYDELRSLLDSSVRVLDSSLDDARNAAISAAQSFDRNDAEDDAAAVQASVPEVEEPPTGEDPVPQPTESEPLETLEAVEEPDPVEDDSAHAEPIEPEPADSQPVEPEPIEDELVEPEPVVPEPVEPEPVEPEPEPPMTARQRREAERRTIVQRERRPEPPPGTVPIIQPIDDSDDTADQGDADLESIMIDTILDGALGGTSSAVATESDDEPAVDTPAPSREAAPVRPMASPPLFGPRDSNIDELFKRIRSARPSASEGSEPEAQQAAGRESIGGLSPEDPAGSSTAAEHSWTGPAMFAAVDDLDPIKVAATSALKRVLADQLNEVLDARRRVDHPVSIDDLLPSQTTVFGDAIAIMIAEAAQRGHRGLVPDWDPTPVAAAVSAEVGQALRRRVARLVESGTDDLDVRVRAVYREWRRERVEEVARQATTAAFNLGALAIVPDGTSVAWTMRDGDCPVEECAANTNAGPVAPGSVFPSGHVVPPVSAGCRCLVVPSDR